MKHKEKIALSLTLCFIVAAIIMSMQSVLAESTVSGLTSRFLLSPPTGDDTNTSVWLIIGGIALIAIAVMIVLMVMKSKKRK